MTLDILSDTGKLNYVELFHKHYSLDQDKLIIMHNYYTTKSEKYIHCNLKFNITI